MIEIIRDVIVLSVIMGVIWGLIESARELPDQDDED